MQLKISHLVSSMLQTLWFNFNFFVLNFNVLKSAFKKCCMTAKVLQASSLYNIL